MRWGPSRSGDVSRQQPCHQGQDRADREMQQLHHRNHLCGADVEPEAAQDRVPDPGRREVAEPHAEHQRPREGDAGATALMPRLMRRAARSPLARNGVGPAQRSVIGDEKNPGHTTVTPTP